jgi:TolB protein
MNQFITLECPKCSGDLEEVTKSLYVCPHCGRRFKERADEDRLVELVEWQCPHCSFNNDRGSKHCGKCGTPLVKRCPICSNEIRWDLQYCTRCGHAYSRAKVQISPISVEQPKVGPPPPQTEIPIAPFESKLAKLRPAVRPPVVIAVFVLFAVFACSIWFLLWNRQDVAGDTDPDLAWSLDGTSLNWSWGNGHTVDYVVNVSNAEKYSVSLCPTDDPDRWSQDWAQIAFVLQIPGESESIRVPCADLTDLRIQPSDLLRPAWSSDGKQFAFTSRSNGNRDVYVASANGTEAHNLSNHPAKDYSPAWSPNDSYIAFISDRDGNSEVYIANADGSNLRNVSNRTANDLNPNWSPSSAYIAFVSEEDVFVVSADEGNLHNLSNHPEDDGSPSWSPDGARVAFASNRSGNWDIYIVDIDGSNLRNLTNLPSQDFDPTWLPDGRIAFVSNSSGPYGVGNNKIYVVNADGSNLIKVNENVDGISEAWSPDGTHVAFISNDHASLIRVGSDNREIYVVNADGTNLRRLTYTRRIHWLPAWGQWEDWWDVVRRLWKVP